MYLPACTPLYSRSDPIYKPDYFHGTRDKPRTISLVSKVYHGTAIPTPSRQTYLKNLANFQGLVISIVPLQA